MQRVFQVRKDDITGGIEAIEYAVVNARDGVCASLEHGGGLLWLGCEKRKRNRKEVTSKTEDGEETKGGSREERPAPSIGRFFFSISTRSKRFCFFFLSFNVVCRVFFFFFSHFFAMLCVCVIFSIETTKLF